mmetsp:Transcript_51763/g.129968  ORF Transcript_51763/g.129968 Transcript_51763/m.129968 type:complete len:201 (+) Transcript_51763:163-765(+)
MTDCVNAWRHQGRHAKKIGPNQSISHSFERCVSLGIDKDVAATRTTPGSAKRKKPARPHMYIAHLNLAVAALHVLRQLSRHTQRMTHLCLAGSVFSEELCDAHALDASAQQLVEVVGARRHLEDSVALRHQDRPAHERIARLQLAGRLQNLVDFGVAESLDLRQFLAGALDDTHDGRVAGALQLVDVGHVDAHLLQLLNQ